MNLSEIKIIYRHEYGDFEEVNPSSSTISILSVIVRDPEFLIQREILFKELSLEGVNSNFERIDTEQYRGYRHHPHTAECIRFLLKRYRLPVDYEYSLFSLLFFNVFAEYPRNPCFFIEHPSLITTYLKDSQQENVGALIFLEKISKEKLHKWIDENWEYLEDKMLGLPEDKEINRYKNGKIAEEIIELKEKGKSNNEISDILASKFPHNDNVLDVAWIKSIRSRHLKRVKTLKAAFRR